MIFLRYLIVFLGFLLSSFSISRAEDSIEPALKSVLDVKADVPSFGKIAYRSPLPEAKGPAVVLLHGIYGGATHRAYTELLPLLDQKGFRVFVLDLPGAGESESPKKVYSVELLQEFLHQFLTTVIKEPSVVVAESVMGVVALEAAKRDPEWFRRLVLLSPTGVKTLAKAPSPRESILFETVYGNETAGQQFYESLLSDQSVRYFLKKAYNDDALVTDLRVRESRLGLVYPDSKWLAFSFVGGRIYRPFALAAADVFVPVAVVLGANAQAVGFDPQMVETVEGFQAVRGDFQYHVLEQCGQSVQRERPQSVVRIIEAFSEAD